MMRKYGDAVKTSVKEIQQENVAVQEDTTLCSACGLKPELCTCKDNKNGNDNKGS